LPAETGPRTENFLLGFATQRQRIRPDEAIFGACCKEQGIVRVATVIRLRRPPLWYPRRIAEFPGEKADVEKLGNRSICCY
jgi:hypothetical protein